jgi:hypothetical protein
MLMYRHLTGWLFVGSLVVGMAGFCAGTSATAQEVNRMSATRLNGMHFADQFANIQKAISEAGTPSSLTIPSNYTGTDAFTKTNSIGINDLRGKPDREKGFVNAVTDCGVPADRTTDATAAMNACIDANPGRKIFIPLIGSQTVVYGGGFVSNTCDYKFTGSLHALQGNGSGLIGPMHANWFGTHPHLCWPNTMTTPMISISPKCYSCEVGGFKLDGANGLSAFSDQRVWMPENPGYTFRNQTTNAVGFGADGILVSGLGAYLHDLHISGVNRHGIYCEGNSEVFDVATWGNSNCDYGHAERIIINTAKQYAWLMGGGAAGGDTAGWTSTEIDVRGGLMGGLLDVGVNNVWRIQSEDNGRQMYGEGNTQAIATVRVSSNIKSIVTSAAPANGVQIVGMWLVTGSAADGTFDSLCKGLTVSGNTITCNFLGGHADGSTTGGTVRTASIAEIQAYYRTLDNGRAAFNGGRFAVFGPHMDTTASNGVTLAPYAEGGQIDSALQNTLILGGSQDSPTGVVPSIHANSGIIQMRSPLLTLNKTDASNYVAIGSGISNDNDAEIRFTDYRGVLNRWRLWMQHGSGGGNKTNFYRSEANTNMIVLSARNDSNAGDVALSSFNSKPLKFNFFQSVRSAPAEVQIGCNSSVACWQIDAKGKMKVGGSTVSGGIDPAGRGMTHKRVTTGSIAASANAAVTVTWTAALADTNYTVTCSVLEATASNSTLRVHHIQSVSTTSAVIRVVNDDTSAAHTGTLHCIAMHD